MFQILQRDAVQGGFLPPSVAERRGVDPILMPVHGVAFASFQGRG
jgi:hypothetical protein